VLSYGLDSLKEFFGENEELWPEVNGLLFCAFFGNQRFKKLFKKDSRYFRQQFENW